MMDRLFKFGFTPHENSLDHYFHEVTLAFLILAVTGLIGLFFGWLLWRGSRKRCAAIERENRDLLKRYQKLKKSSSG